MKALQKFSKEYLEECKKLTPLQIAEFLEDFRLLHGPKINSKSKLISIKIPEDLLTTFRRRCELDGVPYQTQIKKLMLEWTKMGKMPSSK